MILDFFVDIYFRSHIKSIIIYQLFNINLIKGDINRWQKE